MTASTIRSAAATRPATASAVLSRMAGLLNRLIEADRTWRETRHLHRLPDHLLQDSGLTRTEAQERYAPRLR